MFSSALVLGLLLGCEQPQQASPAPKPRPVQLPGPLSPIQFDEAASKFADALRRWPAVERTDAPFSLASPRWRNLTDMPVKEGPTFVRELCETMNLRTGAKVRIASPGAVGCRFATEISLEPATNPQTEQPTIVLAFRVVQTGSAVPLFEERYVAWATPSTLPARFASGGKSSAVSGQPATAPASTPIVFEKGQVSLDPRLRQRLAILSERTYRDAAGQLCVEVKLLSRWGDVIVDLSGRWTDQAGRQTPLARKTRQTLGSLRPMAVTIVLPKTAQTYNLDILLVR